MSSIVSHNVSANCFYFRLSKITHFYVNLLVFLDNINLSNFLIYKVKANNPFSLSRVDSALHM